MGWESPAIDLDPELFVSYKRRGLSSLRQDRPGTLHVQLAGNEVISFALTANLVHEYLHTQEEAQAPLGRRVIVRPAYTGVPLIVLP